MGSVVIGECRKAGICEGKQYALKIVHNSDGIYAHETAFKQ